MNFISLHYIVFLPIVVTAFYLIPHHYRWILLLAASYYFYMCWKAEYALLIVFSTLVDYFTAIFMDKTEAKKDKQHILILSLVVNLGLLFFFKYFNFISSSLEALNSYLGFKEALPHFNILLPVGISFYTFQSLAYTIDVYRGKKKAEKHLGYFALYVIFFPQLVAGPIERASRLLRQFFIRIKFQSSNIYTGLRYILWGALKKIVIADHLSLYVNNIYNNVHSHHGCDFLIATVLFAFQIYCDFSGYSDIAVGSARLLGYDLMQNFNYPYFSTSIRQFWQRWHISLTTWFRDYLYIPLGGNRVSAIREDINIFIVFMLSGLWHGASWTFILWGFLHALYFLGYKLISRVRYATPQLVSTIFEPMKVLLCFTLVNFAWIFFRANSVHDLAYILRSISQISSLSLNNVHLKCNGFNLIFAIASVVTLLVIEWSQYRFKVLDKFLTLHWMLRLHVYLFAVILILLYCENSGQDFVYFQF